MLRGGFTRDQPFPFIMPSSAARPRQIPSRERIVVAGLTSITSKCCTTDVMPSSTPHRAASSTGCDGLAVRVERSVVHSPMAAAVASCSGVTGFGRRLKPHLGSLWPTQGDEGTVVRLGSWFSTESTECDTEVWDGLSLHEARKQRGEVKEPRAEDSQRRKPHAVDSQSSGFVVFVRYLKAVCRAAKVACGPAGLVRK
jgi:hypothetical protein